MAVIFRQFGPLLFLIIISLITSFSSDFFSSGSAHNPHSKVKEYDFSFTQSYVYPHKLHTTHLKQPYFVNQNARHDFKRSKEKKSQTDDRVDDQIIKVMDKQCADNKRQR
mmetsp:Transcript_14490/g.22489  ORF Transcript_14490/g.22489 Transcript_14490/m.22489 type:complete len:110 (-) Transcript_14490:172-501(-)